MPEFSLAILYVDSPASSAEFYRALLGRAPIEQSETFAMFPLARGRGARALVAPHGRARRRNGRRRRGDLPHGARCGRGARGVAGSRPADRAAAHGHGFRPQPSWRSTRTATGCGCSGPHERGAAARCSRSLIARPSPCSGTGIAAMRARPSRAPSASSARSPANSRAAASVRSPAALSSNAAPAPGSGGPNASSASSAPTARGVEPHRQARRVMRHQQARASAACALLPPRPA